MTAALRVLHLQLEWPTWQAARSWSYSAGMAMEEGLAAAGAEFLTITAPWFDRAREICDGRHFDQVWVDISRSEVLNDDWLTWLTEIAPTRIGFMEESLEYLPEEMQTNPELAVRKQKAWNRLRYVTHVVAIDERDAELVAVFGNRPAIWWPMAVPHRYQQTEAPPASAAPALFSGALYGARGAWLSHPSLTGLLTPLRSREHATIYPRLFDGLHAAASAYTAAEATVDAESNEAYLEELRRIRRASFAMWMDGLQAGCGVVNLPTFVKSYTSRVVETLSAGRPALSWQVPDRPRITSLFEDGREILLFPKDSPEVLAEHIRHLLSEPTFAYQLAQCGLKKAREFHTVEKRVQQILRWIEDGTEPIYS